MQIIGTSKKWNYRFASKLIHVGSILDSFRNQSVDLDSKSIDWFLYECNVGLVWINGLMSHVGRDKLTFREYLIHSQHYCIVLTILLVMEECDEN